MQAEATGGAEAAAGGPARARIGRVPAAVLLVALLALVLLINPVGYVGGGADDWQYLQAAECWARDGACLPHDHWSARWPLIAPMAAAMGLLGESRFSVGLVPLLYAGAAFTLFAFIAERLFGRAAAIVGGAALLLTPVFSLALLQPNVDVVELAFLLAAVAAALQAAESRRRGWAFASGIGLALAALTRETSFVFVAVAAAWFLFMRQADKRLFAWAAPGFALPVLAEMLVYWAATGDALRRLHLSFGHTRLPSTELSAAVDTSRSPFFNPDFIAGWRPANGIDVHWTVDPLLNLFTHPQTGLTLLAGILLLCVYGGKGILPAPQARWAKLFMASAGAAAFLLIYALAIDPKPRMFVPLAAASALAIGAVAPHLWAAKSRLLLVVASIVVGGQSLLVLAAAPAVRGAESVAANWIAGAAPRTMTLSPNTSSHLALVPSARSLPVDAPGLFELHLSFGGCAAEADGRAVLRSWSFLDGEPALTALARRYLPMQASAERYFLCLYAPR